MVAKELLAPRYMQLFEAFCVSVVFMRRSAAIVEATGTVVKGQRDQAVVVNPASREFARYARLVQMIGSELGLSPASTAAIGRDVSRSIDRASPERLLS